MIFMCRAGQLLISEANQISGSQMESQRRQGPVVRTHLRPPDNPGRGQFGGLARNLCLPGKSQTKSQTASFWIWQNPGTVGAALDDWLANGLSGRSDRTRRAAVIPTSRSDRIGSQTQSLASGLASAWASARPRNCARQRATQSPGPAILTFVRCTSVVIGSPRRSSVLPPSTITIRMPSLLTRSSG